MQDRIASVAVLYLDIEKYSCVVIIYHLLVLVQLVRQHLAKCCYSSSIYSCGCKICYAITCRAYMPCIGSKAKIFLDVVIKQQYSLLKLVELSYSKLIHFIPHPRCWTQCLFLVQVNNSFPIQLSYSYELKRALLDKDIRCKQLLFLRCWCSQ